MNSTEFAAYLKALKKHIQDFYGQGLRQRYEINTLADCDKPASTMAISIDFSFDFFLL